MRTRPNILLNARYLLSVVCFAALCAVGCGTDSVAGGEFRDFAEVPDQEQLPTITPGQSSDPDEKEHSPDKSDELVTVGADDKVPVESVETPEASPPVNVTEAAGSANGAKPSIKLLIPEKEFAVDRKTKAIRVSYDDLDLLKVLNMDPVPVDAVSHFPEWLNSLDGRTVRIRGFMFPAYVATGITSFRMARDNEICCFKREPMIYDVMMVRLADGETTRYIQNIPFDVVGTFHIDPVVEDGDLLDLYRIDNARVIER